MIHRYLYILNNILKFNSPGKRIRHDLKTLVCKLQSIDGKVCKSLCSLILEFFYMSHALNSAEKFNLTQKRVTYSNTLEIF